MPDIHTSFEKCVILLWPVTQFFVIYSAAQKTESTSCTVMYRAQFTCIQTCSYSGLKYLDMKACLTDTSDARYDTDFKTIVGNMLARVTM